MLRGEDANGNGVLDPGEDWDKDGRLDVVEKELPANLDTDNDGTPDDWIDRDGDGEITVVDKFEDVDNDNYRDGRNVDSLWAMIFGTSSISDIDFTMIGFIAGLAAIAGSGGLSNTPTSNYTRDQGWGMGHHVGAIPSAIGGHDIE